MKQRISLEPEACTIVEESSQCPLIFQLPVEEGRKKLEEAQNAPVTPYQASIDRMMFVTNQWGNIPVYTVTPCNNEREHNLILYLHGAGWVFGSFHTHYKLVCELAARTNSFIVFPEYSRSPEAKYPIAIEQCYNLLCSLASLVQRNHWNVKLNSLIVAGDSVGGNMTAAMTLLSKYRHGPYINGQVLYYPVTDACFNTVSYDKFACDYYLYRAGMMWFWDQYTECLKDRDEITASPLRASIEQLRGLPPAIILNGEADVLRAEGEAYARKLRCAGVDVTAIRYQAIIHDFVMLNALDQTKACRAAMDSSTSWINQQNEWVWQ